MRKYFLGFLLCFVLTSTAESAQVFPNQPNNAFIIDDFEDKDLSRYPLWWKFGDADVSIDTNRPKQASYLGDYSMRIKGQPNEWYVGGVGTYFGIDGTPFNALKMIVKGKGESSGTLILELYDDDNNTWEVEKHPDYPSQPLEDDRFIYTQKVTWDGWKVLIIPFSHFSDVNPGIGDDIWNPNQDNGSGGLLQFQMIVMAVDKHSTPDVWIDSLKFFKKTELKYQAPKKKPVYLDWL